MGNCRLLTSTEALPSVGVGEVILTYDIPLEFTFQPDAYRITGMGKLSDLTIKEVAVAQAPQGSEEKDKDDGPEQSPGLVMINKGGQVSMVFFKSVPRLPALKNTDRLVLIMPWEADGSGTQNASTQTIVGYCTRYQY